MTIETLYEDDAVLVVNKPAGIAVIPGRDERPAQSLRGVLEAQRSEGLWVVHRLDRDTSGAVLFARTAAAHRAASMAFEARKVDKRYVAFVRSERALEREGTIRAALHAARKGKMRPAHEGEADALASETSWRVSASRPSAVGLVSEVEAMPHTGRQHQIRVHFRWLGAPLLVDELYGQCASRPASALGEGSPAVERLTLHATTLSIPHPSDAGRLLTIDAALPADLAALARWVRAEP